MHLVSFHIRIYDDARSSQSYFHYSRLSNCLQSLDHSLHNRTCLEEYTLLPNHVGLRLKKLRKQAIFIATSWVFFSLVPNAQVHEALRKLMTRGQIHFLQLRGLWRSCNGKFVLWSPLDVVRKSFHKILAERKSFISNKMQQFFLSRLKVPTEEDTRFFFSVFIQLNVRQTATVTNSSLTLRVDKH